MSLSRNAWIAVILGGLALLWLYSKRSTTGSILTSANVGTANSSPPPVATSATAPASAAGAAAINAANAARNMTPPAPVQKLLGFVGL